MFQYEVLGDIEQTSSVEIPMHNISSLSSTLSSPISPALSLSSEQRDDQDSSETSATLSMSQASLTIIKCSIGNALTRTLISYY